MNKLSVSIVNFNSGDFLAKCLNSLKKVRTRVSLEIFVTDNASTDESIQKAKRVDLKVHYILNKENLGFGRAHNQALKKATGELILILNPDTLINLLAIETMVQFMENNIEVGASTCKVVHQDGSIDWASHRGFPTPLASLLYFFGIRSLYHLTNKDLNAIHEVDSITGAFFLTRRNVLEKVGLFDEIFFMYGEDIDLCYRIKQAGFKIMYVPEVQVVHYKGISTGLKKHSQEITTANLETRKRSLGAFYNAMKIFYEKHYQKNYPFFINWLILTAINLKWLLAKRKLII